MGDWPQLLAFAIMRPMNSNAHSHPEFPLWKDGTPGALGTTPDDIPTLTPYLPEAGEASGAAIVVCPGGAYGYLAGHEGRAYAEWLRANGVAAFVLKYRLGTNGYRHPAMLHDAARALRTVRAGAQEWRLDAKRVGIIGSSAGGHLAATLLTHFDSGTPASKDPVERVSSRPDVGILCYPVISMEAITHEGSKVNLLGEAPSPQLVDDLSNENRVTTETPPCFMFHTWEDDGVQIENALAFASALQAHGVRFDLHVYEAGGHGMGLGKDARDPTKLHPWTSDCLYWLRLHGFVT